MNLVFEIKKKREKKKTKTYSMNILKFMFTKKN